METPQYQSPRRGNTQGRDEIRNCHIRENSRLAWVAAKKLSSPQVAMVLGKTIHLWGTSRENFLKNHQWVRHELCHVRQFARHGFCKFLLLYLWETLRHGYYENRFEQEARQAETL